MVCAPGHEKLTFQPFVATVPEFVTVKPSWKPPLHELTTDQVTWQASPGGGVVGGGVEGGRVEGGGVEGGGVEGGGTVEGGGLVGGGVVGGGVVGGGGGGWPLPFVKTTAEC